MQLGGETVAESRTERRMVWLLLCAALATAAPLFGQTESGRRETGSTAAPLVPNPLTLDDALQFAREHHPDLRVAGAEVQVVLAESISARTRPFNPELELGMSRGGESFASGDEGSFELGLLQEFDLWGKRRERRALAAARLSTVQAELEARRQQIELRIGARFQRALTLQRRLVVLSDLTEQERSVVNSTWARVRDESQTSLTGRLTELDWLRIQRQLLKARADHRRAAAELALAIGGTLEESVELVGDVHVDTLTVSEDTLVNVALARRRELQALQLRVTDRQSDLRLARVDGRPNLTLAAGLMRERTSFDAANFSGDPAVVGGITGVEDVDHLWQVRLALPIPLWQRNQGEQARAAAEVAQARFELETFEFRTSVEVRAAVRAFNDAADLYRLYLERSDRVREDLALVRAAYVDGRIAFESYLTQKGRLVDTLLDQLEAEDEYWETRGALETAVAASLDALRQGGSR